MAQISRDAPYQILKMPRGHRAIDFTLDRMRAEVRHGKIDVDIRRKAAELVQHLPQKDQIGEISTIFEFVQHHIRYVKDITDVETLHEAWRVLRQEHGDCDDKCILLASLLEAIGHRTRFVAVGFQHGKYSHVFCDVKTRGGWLSLDATENRPMGWRPPRGKSFKVRYNDDETKPWSGHASQLAGGDQDAAEGESLLPAIGTVIGGPIGGAVGSVLQVVTSLFGGKEHYTPGGVPYNQLANDLTNNQLAILSLQNQLATLEGKPTTPLPTYAPGGTLARFQQMAAILNSYGQNVAGTQGGIAAAMGNGTFDTVLELQKAEVSSLNDEITGASELGGGAGGSVLQLVSTYWPFLAAGVGVLFLLEG